VTGRFYKEGKQAGNNLLNLKLMADQHLLNTYIRTDTEISEKFVKNKYSESA